MKTIFCSMMILLGTTGCASSQTSGKISFKEDPAGKKLEVLIDNQFFTAFLYPDDMEKQVLYPIMTPSGKDITRGYPLNPRPFERVDHPHHVGLWFNFGDVNRLDFWNNSFAIPAENKHRYGSIKFGGFASLNAETGTMKALGDWVDNSGKILLKEESTFVFAQNDGIRSIDRTTTLTAVEQVTFTESKEGMFGLRVDRAFEELLTAPELLLDAEGKEMEEKSINNDGVNGVYRNAEGLSGPAVWGTRSPWVALRAEKEGEAITLVMLDHPKNLNYPAWYHARGYGLFAANNLGGRGFDRNAEPVRIVLEPGQSITFRHKLLIGGNLTDEQINHLSNQFQ